MRLVKSRSIERASLHAPLPLHLHAYSLPSLPLYALYVYLVYFHESFYHSVLGSYEAAMVLLILVAAVHALMFLSCQWSVAVCARLTCRAVSAVESAAVIEIIPAKHKGKGELCAIVHDKVPYFTFQKRKFIYNPSCNTFEKIAFPIHKAQTLHFFHSSRGLSNDKLVAEAIETYGINSFDIPIPSFIELFKEHAVAPFFVFQLFCVCLWFMDEMWYYSIFTLVMLVVFESTVVFQRLRTLKEFRSMNLTPYNILVFRKELWKSIPTTSLVPGDVISLTRPSDESYLVPADVLLLQGNVVVNEAMLSGESTPLVKESINLRDSNEKVDKKMEEFKPSMVFGGTKILQASPFDLQEEEETPSSTAKFNPPNHGAVGYVLKTGFNTTQGKLVRTIIYSTERVTANNLESLLFILFLLVFAIAAAYYVWIESFNNPDRKRSKVILDCILIITSVVPPELPMELSLAVNNSLIALAKQFVYVTEPFRIPFAGKIDVVALDKTGTLTETDLVVEGIVGLSRNNRIAEFERVIGVDALKASKVDVATLWCLVGAQALISIVNDDQAGDNPETKRKAKVEVVGDPMEKSTLDAVGWTVKVGEWVVPNSIAALNTSTPLQGLKVLRRFPFSSALKRMSSISDIHGYDADRDALNGRKKYLVACKGAPETIMNHLKTIPEDYELAYKTWARKGSRVIALAYRFIDKKDVKDYSRDQVESNLIFAGFLSFRCPLKKDSIKTVKMLNSSSHRCVMITGDNALTACHVAAECAIIRSLKGVEVLIGDVRKGQLEWRNIDETTVIPIELDAPNPPDLFAYDLCITGKALEVLASTKKYIELLPRIWVYARVSPSQKEYILTTMKSVGYMTIMCGDGTNDVGALKQAHVGIALLDGKPEDMAKIASGAMKRRTIAMLKQRLEFERRYNMKLPALPADQQRLFDELRVEQERKTIESAATVQQHQQQQQRLPKKPQTPQEVFTDAMKTFDTALEDNDVPTIKFGDASVAAPFTSKLSSPMAVVNIVRQGRSTLVAMMQMYKILALNCLISAYSMSVMYLAGIKQGDWQATVAGLLITVCFFSVAKSSPLEKLSKQRPQSNIFNFYIVLSVLGQAAVHVGALVYIRAEAIRASKDLDENIDLDAEFQPNVLNSAVYLISLVMQIATFGINYQGHPFRESFMENKPLKNSIMMVGAIAFVAASELIPELNNWMQLVPLPADFQPKLLFVMVLDLVLAATIEQICKFLFAESRPKHELLLEDGELIIQAGLRIKDE